MLNMHFKYTSQLAAKLLPNAYGESTQLTFAVPFFVSNKRSGPNQDLGHAMHRAPQQASKSKQAKESNNNNNNNTLTLTP